MHNQHAVLVLSLLLAAAAASAAADEFPTGCRDEDGSPVDWFVVLKMPHLRDSTDVCAQDGGCYVYADANDPAVRWTGQTIETASKAAVGATTQQLFDRHASGSLMYGIYNDQPAHGRFHPPPYGHAKGFFAMDEHQGFWMLHSVPHFPPASNETYEYPHSGLMYGQSFLCVTLPVSAFDEIGTQLQYYRPWWYDVNIPDSLGKEAPQLVAAMHGRYTTRTGTSALDLHTIGGTVLQHFAKDQACNCDLWIHIAERTASDILVESWRHGHSSEQSYCRPEYKYEARNIETISLPMHDITWPSAHDHSKWGVVADADLPVVCLGGINRMGSQKARGGGAMCIRSGALHSFFLSIIAKQEQCPDSAAHT